MQIWQGFLTTMKNSPTKKKHLRKQNYQNTKFCTLVILSVTFNEKCILTHDDESRSLFHKSGHNGVQCRNKSVTESVSPDLWTLVNLWAALLQPAPTLSDLGWPWHICGCSRLPPRRHCRLRSVFFFHFLALNALYPFLSFSHVFGNSLPPSLPPWPGWRWPTTAGSLCLAGRVPKIHVLFLECGLDTNCILPCFCFHSLFFLDDMKPDGFGWLGFVTVWWIWGLPALD